MGEAKRRAKAPINQQIVLCYEGEPYLAFEVTPLMAEQAVNDDPNAEWLIAGMNWLRDEVALIRDHSDEVLADSEQRTTLIYNAIMLVQHLLATKKQRLDQIPGVLLNLHADQAKSDPRAPAFEIVGLSEPLSADDIRAMSSARHLYVQDGDEIQQDLMKTERSKDRNKTRSCIAIGAFWRNDKPGGVGLNMEAEEGGDLNVEMEILDQLVMKLAEAKPPAADFESYISHMAQQQEANGIEIAAAIAYAEEAGFLASDDYNGMLYIYRNDDEFYVDRKDGGGMSGIIKP